MNEGPECPGQQGLGAKWQQAQGAWGEEGSRGQGSGLTTWRLGRHVAGDTVRSGRLQHRAEMRRPLDLRVWAPGRGVGCTQELAALACLHSAPDAPEITRTDTEAF